MIQKFQTMEILFMFLPVTTCLEWGLINPQGKRKNE